MIEKILEPKGVKVTKRQTKCGIKIVAHTRLFQDRSDGNIYTEEDVFGICQPIKKVGIQVIP